MCGLAAAVWRFDGKREVIAAACQRMRARGPDAEGYWHGQGVSLGHRRLAILDLDARANQPMHSACGRYAIVYNGEIYNFRNLGEELRAAGVELRTSSDTEVLLALFAREKEAMLPRLRGMFAFAIWDATERRLFIARDPYGIKPLYLAETPDGVLVASQVKAILSTGMVSRDPDPRGQAGFWLTGSVPEPRTWYRAIRALQAGGLAWIDQRGAIASKRWCDVADQWRYAQQTGMTDQEVTATVHAALRRSAEAHLVSDVPVGVFLSGGIDSGAIAGLMRESGAIGLKGVTLGFREFAGKHQDEAPMAARVAAECGMEHHVRVVTRHEFEQDIPSILDAMDQPSVDGVNTWFASKAVAEIGLKVVVSGLGGDELFQGYRHFRYLPSLVAAWSRGARIPGAVAATDFISRLQARRSGNARWRHFSSLARSLPGAWFLRRGLFAPEELPDIMGEEMAAGALRGFDAEQWVAEQCGSLPSDPQLALSLIESTLYLRNQLLRDSDWASMAHSVELRTPLVDSWLLRDVMQVGTAILRFPRKALLSSAAALPSAVSDRRKTGFDTPINNWLAEGMRRDKKHPTRSWARFLTERHARFV